MPEVKLESIDPETHFNNNQDLEVKFGELKSHYEMQQRAFKNAQSVQKMQVEDLSDIKLSTPDKIVTKNMTHQRTHNRNLLRKYFNLAGQEQNLMAKIDDAVHQQSLSKQAKTINLLRNI